MSTLIELRDGIKADPHFSVEDIKKRLCRAERIARINSLIDRFLQSIDCKDKDHSIKLFLNDILAGRIPIGPMVVNTEYSDSYDLYGVPVGSPKFKALVFDFHAGIDKVSLKFGEYHVENELAVTLRLNNNIRQSYTRCITYDALMKDAELMRMILRSEPTE